MDSIASFEFGGIAQRTAPLGVASGERWGMVVAENPAAITPNDGRGAQLPGVDDVSEFSAHPLLGSSRQMGRILASRNCQSRPRQLCPDCDGGRTLDGRY